MKRLLLVCMAALMAATALAQDEPTTKWPYLYPEFKAGELMRVGKAPVRALYNVHLSLSSLHYVGKNGRIKEADTWGVTGLVVGEDKFHFVAGKMLKILAETEGGYIVKEYKANYSSVIKDDGAYGSSSLTSTTTKSFLYNENALNQYNGYLMTDVYKDLLAMKNDAEKLPVLEETYLVIGNQLIVANKKSVNDMEGLAKKAFKAFLKENDINWNKTEDLVKVLDYLTAK